MLDTAQRLFNYIADNERGQRAKADIITPAQCRRIKKKENQSAKKASNNTCPRCQATGDNPCVTPSGKTTKTHKGRGE